MSKTEATAVLFKVSLTSTVLIRGCEYCNGLYSKVVTAAAPCAMASASYLQHAR